MLPNIDDGAADLPIALAMARMAVQDGIGVVACTPHIYPGLYNNTGKEIVNAATLFSAQLVEASIPLQVTTGADVHLDLDLVSRLRSSEIPTLGKSRYFLLEFPHRSNIKGMRETVFNVLSSGYVPIITHPERQAWIGEYYEEMVAMARQGAWLQVTANSLTGCFGRNATYWAEKMLDDGVVHLLATDAHNTTKRPPILSEGRTASTRWVSEAEAEHMVLTRPAGILNDVTPNALPAPPGLSAMSTTTAKRRVHRGWWRRLLGH